MVTGPTDFQQAKTTDEAVYRDFFHAMLAEGVALAPGAYEALFVGVGYQIGGPTGMAIALAFALVGNLISYSNADKIVLSMYRAQEVTANHPDARVRTYASDVREMAQRAGLPMPKITIIESDQPNAFATGRDPDHAAVAATTGLLTMLDRREIRAVMGHELAHVKNRDTLTMTVTATIAGAISPTT